MTNEFRELYLALKDAGNSMIAASHKMNEASQATTQANQALVRLGEMAMNANGEHEDLRETIARLEGEVMTLVHEVRSLRDQRQ
jgi:ABC-type uncharacterized transport system ATPase subunit